MKEKLFQCGEDETPVDFSDLERFCGEGRFYMGIVEDMVARIADSEGQHCSTVSAQVVLNAVREIVDIYRSIKGWKLEFQSSSDDFKMDSDIASSLFSVVENCLFDINSLSLKSGDEDLLIELDIRTKGSFIEAVIRDNCRSNSIIENVDIAAYYPGLISIRNSLKNWKGLLWVDRSVENGERFRVTLPASRKRTDYRIIQAGGRELGLLSGCIEEVLEFDEQTLKMEQDRYYYDGRGGKVPVFSIDELAGGEVEADYNYNYLVVFGIAEERIAVLSENEGYRIETVPEQAVEENQLSISGISLQIGDNSYPVLDIAMILEKLDILHEKDLSYVAPVSSADTGIA
jgi:hypothetical protein